MTYKQRETSREIRLWIGQVIVPGVVLATTVLSNPELRNKAVSKAKSMKESITKRFKKKKMSLRALFFLFAKIAYPFMRKRKEALFMVLFAILAVIVISLVVFTILTIGTVGAAVIIPLADVIICVVLVIFIMKKLIFKKRK